MNTSDTITHRIEIDGAAREILIRPMGEDFILWRCLHHGALSPDTIEQCPNAPPEWPVHRAINVPLLTKLVRTYGTCAILAWDGDAVVGSLRFYPKAVCEMSGGDGMCMQQPFPAGPSETLVDRDFPPLEQIKDKTLSVHCLMAGSRAMGEAYHRKGFGGRMVEALIQWATSRGWRAIEATALADLPLVYDITGQAGPSFWEKHGFRTVKTEIEPLLQGEHEFVATLRQQAAERGLDPDSVANKYVMRLELSR
jgi:GNAT superfamily N-acetyltransferase